MVHGDEHTAKERARKKEKTQEIMIDIYVINRKKTNKLNERQNLLGEEKERQDVRMYQAEEKS